MVGLHVGDHGLACRGKERVFFLLLSEEEKE
jgi:hypothetical protein